MELRGGAWRGLARDPFVATCAFVLAAAGAAYVDPPSDPEALSGAVHLALLGVSTLAVLLGTGRLRDRDERSFWAWIGVSCLVWLATEVLHQWANAGPRVLWALVVSDTFYLLTYLAWFIAIDHEPGIRHERRTSSPASVRRLAKAGNALFSLACVAYFVLIPSTAGEVRYTSSAEPGLAFSVLDAVLLVRIWRLAAHAVTARWRAIHGALTVAAALWLAADLVQLAIDAGVAELPFGTALDFLWFVPFVPLVLAARLKNAAPERPATHAPVALDRARRSTSSVEPGLLLAYALLLPILHLALDAAGIFGDDTRPARGALALSAALGLIVLAFLQARAIEKDRRSLESRVSSLVTNEQARENQKMEALGRLACGVAHDFNNLLTVIQGYSSMLRERPDPPEEVRRKADSILVAARRGASLAGQLLAFGRRQAMRPRRVDLGDEVLEQADMLRRVIGEDVLLEIDLREAEAGPREVEVDPGKLSQILMNLTINARESMGSGGVVRISVGPYRSEPGDEPDAAPAGEYVALEVRDEGCGMDEATRARIFEPFFTTRAHGTGLGLATVYGIVKQSGGHLRVSSEVGVGTTIVVLFPRAPAAGEPAPARPTDRERPRVSDELAPVLVVEDDADLRDLARQMLEAGGYRVRCAADAREALELSAREKGRIGVLLTDVVMPGMSGPELAERLLRDRPETRVVFMSGYPAENLAARGLVRREDARWDETYLQKPFEREDLERSLRRALEGATA